MPSPPSRRRQCLHLEYWELLGTLCLSDHKRDQFSNLIIKLQPMLEDNTLCKVLGGCKFLFCLWPILKDNATHQSLEIFLLLVKDFEKNMGFLTLSFFLSLKFGPVKAVLLIILYYYIIYIFFQCKDCSLWWGSCFFVKENSANKSCLPRKGDN